MMRYLLILALLTTVLGIAPSIITQEATPIPIATNTPRATAPQAIFATNTPHPPTATPNIPAVLSAFALRLWSSADLVQLVEDQLVLLNATGTPDAALTVRLATYELVERFPEALRQPEAQTRLLPLMLAAPRGSVDMRPVARRAVERLASESADAINPQSAGTYTVGEFRLDITPLNASPLTDREVQLTITSPADADPNLLETYVYHDAVLAQFTEDGSLIILPASFDYPAAPFGNIERITSNGIGDFNLDGADELSISITYSDHINQDLLVYAMRGDEAFELTTPGDTMRFGTTFDWSDGTFQMQERLIRPESFWGCHDEQAVTWTWGNNVFVPSVGNITPQTEGAACDLDLMGDLFAQAPGDAIGSIDFVFDGATAEEPLIGRVQLVTAMLQLLNGQLNDAVTTASEAVNTYPQGTARHQQAQAFLAAVGGGQTPLAVCATLAIIEPDVICDVDAVLGRLSAEPFDPDADLSEQLAARGIPIRQIVTIAAVGQRNRSAAHLDLGDGTTWLLFEPADEGLLASTSAPPSGYEPPPPAPQQAFLTNNLLMLLLSGSDRTRVITAIDSLEADPNVAFLSTELRFARAFAHDLAGNRQLAREQYFDLWQSDRDGVWGQFALRHLEQR